MSLGMEFARRRIFAGGGIEPLIVFKEGDKALRTGTGTWTSTNSSSKLTPVITKSMANGYIRMNAYAYQQYERVEKAAYVQYAIQVDFTKHKKLFLDFVIGSLDSNGTTLSTPTARYGIDTSLTTSNYRPRATTEVDISGLSGYHNIIFYADGYGMLYTAQQMNYSMRTIDIYNIWLE